MLKFLTHKLRTHSLNEENVTEKVGVGAAQSALRREGHTATRKWPPRSREQRRETTAGFHIGRVALRCSNTAVTRRTYSRLTIEYIVMRVTVSGAFGPMSRESGFSVAVSAMVDRGLMQSAEGMLSFAGGGAGLRHRVGRRGGARRHR